VPTYKPISKPSAQKRRGSSTPEGRENELVSLAHDLAEQQMKDGTASSQVIVHYLKLGSARERLEHKLLEQQVSLRKAQTDAINEAKSMAELYKDALSAFKSYNGVTEETDEMLQRAH
jgi:hypothetical protein